jgi:ketosteroid isomerase-like protein
MSQSAEPGEQNAAQPMGSCGTALEFAERFVAAYNARDVAGLGRGIHGDTELSLSGGIRQFGDPSAWLEYHQNEWLSFPDVEIEVLQVFGDDRYALVEGVWHATHAGDFRTPGAEEVAATGKHLEVPMALVIEVADGFVARIAGYWNPNVAIGQLGLEVGFSPRKARSPRE